MLTHAGGALNEERVAALAEELHRLIEQGRKVVLVSSGAVGAGMGKLGLPRRPPRVVCGARRAVAKYQRSCL